MKMVDFDVAEHQYRRNTKIDEDIARLHYPQKYVLLEAFNEIYSLDIQEVTDTAFFLKLTDDAIKHYTRVEKKIMNENKKLKKENGELKKENEELKASKEFWREECISNSSLNQILINGLDIAQKQGYEPTNPLNSIFGLTKEGG